MEYILIEFLSCIKRVSRSDIDRLGAIIKFAWGWGEIAGGSLVSAAQAGERAGV